MATLRTISSRNEKGQAVIELALTLPLLLLVVFGIFDFGFMFQRYEVVTNAAREGARVGVLPGYGVTDAQNRALDYLTAAGLGGPTVTTRSAPCTGGLVTNSRCAVAVLGTATISGGGLPAKTVQEITVTVQYDHEFTFVGPLMGLFGSSLGTVRLQAVSTMRLESN
jgi:Flp pilus assembly protein TadG